MTFLEIIMVDSPISYHIITIICRQLYCMKDESFSGSGQCCMHYSVARRSQVKPEWIAVQPGVTILAYFPGKISTWCLNKYPAATIHQLTY
jgi:hypothetical protein